MARVPPSLGTSPLLLPRCRADWASGTTAEERCPAGSVAPPADMGPVAAALFVFLGALLILAGGVEAVQSHGVAVANLQSLTPILFPNPLSPSLSQLLSSVPISIPILLSPILLPILIPNL